MNFTKQGMKDMTRQKLELWLFPPSVEYKEDKQEQISNKKFILMLVLGISVTIICKIVDSVV